MDHLVCGFQLGLTHCSAAVFHRGKFSRIPIKPNQYTLPAVIYLDQNNKVLMGSDAYRKRLEQPERTYFDMFRFLGKTFSNEILEKLSTHYRFPIKDNHEISPSVFLEKILGRLRDLTQDHLDQEIKRVRISVPNFFNKTQFQMIHHECTALGLEVEAILPQAVCSLYAYLSHFKHPGPVGVLDWGGQSLEISLFEIFPGEIHFLGCSGDLFLGGNELMTRTHQEILQMLETKKNVSLKDQPISQQRLLDALELAKIKLSQSPETLIHLPFLIQGKDGPIQLEWVCHLEDFEKSMVPFVDQILSILDDLLGDLGWSQGKLSEVILMGGNTHIPYFIKRLHGHLGISPRFQIDPGEVGLRGLVSENFFNIPVKNRLLPYSIGIADHLGHFIRIFNRFSPVPCSKTIQITTAQDNQRQVNLAFFAGEIRKAKENSHLGNFIFSDLPGKMRGEVLIDLTCHLDTEGNFRIHGREPQSGHVFKSHFQI